MTKSGMPYLDFYGGVAVNSAGNRNAKVEAAIKDQLGDIVHTFNYPYTIPQALLAKKICDTIGMDKIFYQNSGTEANECMIKMVEKIWNRIISDRNRYHIITAKEWFPRKNYTEQCSCNRSDRFNAIQMGFKPMLPGFSYAEYNNLEDFASKVTKNTIGDHDRTCTGRGWCTSCNTGIYRRTPQIM